MGGSNPAENHRRRQLIFEPSCYDAADMWPFTPATLALLEAAVRGRQIVISSRYNQTGFPCKRHSAALPGDPRRLLSALSLVTI